MKITDIIDILDHVSLKIPDNMMRREIVYLCHNSRFASHTCLFFCKRGAAVDGHRYARAAYQNGARFFVVERDVDLPEDAAIIKVENSDAELKKLALEFYGHPADELKIIGITGTKGKTTVALSIYNIMSSCGYKMGYIGTNGVYYNGKIFETANTTPDCLELQRTLREMIDEGVTHVALEVSSQALWQERTYGLSFEACVFTNLYEDHIGGVEHPDMEHYRSCKRKLFTDYHTNAVIVNAESPDAEYMIEGVECRNIIKVSAAGNGGCDYFAENIIKYMNGTRPGVSFEMGGRSFDKRDAFIPIPGRYSVENGLLTAAVCTYLGLDLDTVVDKLSRLTVQGRFEAVDMDTRPSSLFVIDYAHNGASLKAVLNSLKEYEPRRIICLFGSVGGRTFGRRAELAYAARECADIIILTSDNPDSEQPMKILEDINQYLEGTDKTVYLIPDREKAIEKAYEIAGDGDFVLLAGKGHENYQLIKGTRVSFSERRVLERLDTLNKSF